MTTKITEYLLPQHVWDEIGESPEDMPFLLYEEIDFTQWEWLDILEAWQMHGTIDGCIDNVQHATTYPRAYCKLLKTAADHIISGDDI